MLFGDLWRGFWKRVTFPDQQIVLTIRSVTLSRYGSDPAVEIDASAKRGKLQVAVKALAVLARMDDPADLRLTLQAIVINRLAGIDYPLWRPKPA